MILKKNISILGIKGTLAFCEDEVSPATIAPWFSVEVATITPAAVLYCFLIKKDSTFGRAPGSLTQSCRYAHYSILYVV